MTMREELAECRDDARYWESMFLKAKKLYDARLRFSEDLRKSLIIAKAERDALITLVEEIDGRAQEPEEGLGWAEAVYALRAIAAKCKEALNK